MMNAVTPVEVSPSPPPHAAVIWLHQLQREIAALQQVIAQLRKELRAG